MRITHLAQKCLIFTKRYPTTLLVAGLGFIISFTLFWHLESSRLQRASDEFQWAATDRFRVVSHAFDMLKTSLEDIRNFSEVSHSMDLDIFQRFASQEITKHQHFMILAWVPRVVDVERANFEANAAKDFPGYQFVTQNSHGDMVRADRHDDYFPIHYVMPYQNNEILLGFDQASDPARMEAMVRSWNSGEITLSAQIALRCKSVEPYVSTMFIPIYRQDIANDTPEKRHKNLMGFIMGVFRVGDVVENAVKRLEPRGVDFLFRDEDAPAGERFLFRHSSRRYSANKS